MSKPRIAILHYTAPTVIGGVENVIGQHRRLLQAAGYPVMLVAGRAARDKAVADEDLVVVPEIDSQYPQNLQIARALDQGTLPPEFEELAPRIAERLARVLSDSDIVIAHNVFNYHFNLPLTAALHRLLDQGDLRRLVAWCHDISRYVNPASGAEQRGGFPWDLLRTYRPEVSYVTVSQRRRRTLAEVLDCAPDQIQVIPNGVEPRTLLGLSDIIGQLVDEFDLLSADLVLLMPVRITRAKNIEYALRVTAALKETGSVVKLIATGPPDPHSSGIAAYYDQLLALRTMLGLDTDAIFVYEGAARLTRPLLLNPQMVAELYRVCDVVLMPSHREGFGMPVLEAGLLGKPVFATAVPVVEEVGTECVYSIAPDDSPAQLAARLLDWAKHNPAHRLQRRVRQDFTWSTIFRRDIEPLLMDRTKEVQARL
jgi:glycosyltransferase involved in cell wall biosynthesis